VTPDFRIVRKCFGLFAMKIAFVSVRGCGSVYTHTHTHTARGVLGCEPRGRDETLREPEESRWTKSQGVYFHICVQSAHVYIYAGRREAILDQLHNKNFLPRKTVLKENQKLVQILSRRPAHIYACVCYTHIRKEGKYVQEEKQVGQDLIPLKKRSK
jgi:hypothetical protein